MLFSIPLSVSLSLPLAVCKKPINNDYFMTIDNAKVSGGVCMFVNYWHRQQWMEFLLICFSRTEFVMLAMEEVYWSVGSVWILRWVTGLHIRKATEDVKRMHDRCDVRKIHQFRCSTLNFWNSFLMRWQETRRYEERQRAWSDKEVHFSRLLNLILKVSQPSRQRWKVFKFRIHESCDRVFRWLFRI